MISPPHYRQLERVLQPLSHLPPVSTLFSSCEQPLRNFHCPQVPYRCARIYERTDSHKLDGWPGLTPGNCEPCQKPRTQEPRTMRRAHVTYTSHAKDLKQRTPHAKNLELIRLSFLGSFRSNETQFLANLHFTSGYLVVVHKH